MSRNILRLALLTHEEDISRVIALEQSSYPLDEAATESSIRFRQKNAHAFFWAAYLPHVQDQLVGFVNGTLLEGKHLDEESMHRHHPCGSVLCIHSVVIDPAFRRQGLATEMLKRYVAIICDAQPHVQRILLLAKAYFVEFYVKAGFSVTKRSSVVHGKDPWIELQFDCVNARRLRQESGDM
ncbi:hypothetical protein PsorP6_010367 [Peronosclerospora sorghi]|uniref:Uncharacterized protein n=1 Tax=Peronosclerospora sorghi TaxID=230839 RepID=A0ACC0VVR2_9STRA|nr:hypothetical protein PsorP6_010367 [Peronosclerospora sorghi]